MARRRVAATFILLGLLGLGGLAWLALDDDLDGDVAEPARAGGDEAAAADVGRHEPDDGRAPRSDPPPRRRVRVEVAPEPAPAPTPETSKGGVPAPTGRAVVVDEAGRPIPGATVELRGGGLEWRGTAGPDGTFPRDGAGSNGTGPLARESVVRVTAAGFSPNESTLSAEQVWVVTLKGTHRLEGHVFDADGVGVEKASVSVAPAVAGPLQGRTWSTITGTAGAFQVEELPPGNFVVTADAPATRTRPAGHVVATVPADALQVELRLERALRVEGRVVDEAGKPFEGKVNVVMRAVKPNGDAGRVWSGAVVAEDGTFVVEGVNSPKNMLWAWLDAKEAGFAMLVLRDLTPGDPPVDLVLKAGRVIKARFTDDRGTVLSGTTHWYVITRGVGVVNSSTASNGELTTHPLPYDDNYDLIVYHEAGWTGQVRDVRPGTHDVLIPMHRAGDITGSVILPNGEPAGPGIKIHARALNDDNRMRTGVEAKVETGADGRFRITGVADLPFRITTWPVKQGFAPARAAGEHLPGADVVIRLEHGASVTGRVLGADGVPAAKHKLWFLPTDDARWSRTVSTDDAGRFTAGAMPAGAIAVVAERPEGNVTLAVIRAPAKDLRFTLPAK